AQRAPAGQAALCRPCRPQVHLGAMALGLVADGTGPAAAPRGDQWPRPARGQCGREGAAMSTAAPPVNGVPQRPSALPVSPDGIAPEMRQGKRFVLWRYELRHGKWTKPPYRPDGNLADSTDPKTWSTFDEVWAAYLGGGWDGIGRVHLPEDNLVGADAD